MISLSDIRCTKSKAALACVLMSATVLIYLSTKDKNDSPNVTNNKVIGDNAQAVQHPRWNGSEISEMNTKTKETIVGAALALDTGHKHNKLINSLSDGNGTTKHLPDCIMIGVPKGGTFTLIQFLGLHPAIVIPKEEVNFFHIEDNYSQGYKWYLDKLPLSRPGQVTMEKSPRYFYYDHVPKRIKAMRENIKLLVLLRDPIDRAISCYVHRINERQHNGLDYNVTFEDMLIKTSTGEINPKEPCVDRSLYSVHFNRWLQQFPLEQFHFVDGDNLIVDPYAELHEIEPYMNVKTWFQPAMFQFSDTKGFYCVVKPGQQRQYCMPESKGRPHPDIPAHLHKKMINFFQPYNIELTKLVGRKFSWFDKYEVS